VLGILAAVRATLAMPRQVEQYRAMRQLRESGRALNEALQSYLEGRFGRAEKLAERAATSPSTRLDDSLITESLQSITNRRCCHSKHHGQLVFDGELLAASEESERDGAGQSFNNRVGAQHVGEWSKHLRVDAAEYVHGPPLDGSLTITILGNVHSYSFRHRDDGE
jgi:hypothetical protein